MSSINLKKIIIITIIVSFFTSSVVGFLVGSLASQGQMPDWLRNIIKFKSPLSGGEEKKQYTPVTNQEQAVIEAVKKASPAVVSIIVSKDLPVVEQYYTNPFGNDFFNQFFPFGFQVPQYRQKGTEKKEIGGGSGFIISSDGMILTNKHVVDTEGAEYTVLTNDGQKYGAEVLARDPIKDLAIIKIKKAGLSIVKLGNSDNLQIGQSVIAIGNALGEFRNTVSVGVISGLSRSITASGGGQAEQLEEVIQTDAAINQGNSGGPLLNLSGEVIGIDTAMVSGAQSIGFAIPINQAKKDIEDVKSKGKIVYPFLGVRYVLINKTIQEKNNLSVDYGALVQKGENPEDVAVVPGSPADKAGIQENDIILEINGVKINQENTLIKLIQKYKVGDEATLKILRKGEEKTIKVILEERK